MIKTLYIYGDAANQLIGSFETSIPITLVGIDVADGHTTTTSTGTVAVLEYSPWTTRHDGRQWRATMRGE